MKKRLLLAAFLSAAILAGSRTIINAGPAADEKAPGFMLADINGNKVSLQSILSANKPVVLSFFATWCKPCIKELPQLQAISKNTPAKVYLVSIDNMEPEKVAKFLAGQGISLPTLLDPDAQFTGERYGILENGMARIPKLFLITPQGEIAYASKGYDENLESVLKEKIAAVQNAKPAENKKLVLFYTNSANGYMESCDCPTHPYGGLVRRATYLKEQRAKHPNNLLLDTGDILPPYVAPEQAHYLLAMFDALKYDAAAIGDQEFSLDDFVGRIKNHSIPFLSSNVGYCEGDVCSFITPREFTFDKDGIKVAVISILHPDVFALYPDRIVKKLSIISYKDTIAAFVGKHRATADVLVLLSHSGFDEDKLTAQQFPELDVIVGGHSQTLLGTPYKSGKTLIVQAGENAQNVGVLTLTFGKNNKITSHAGEIVPLTKDIPDDPAFRAMITEFRSKPALR